MYSAPPAIASYCLAIGQSDVPVLFDKPGYTGLDFINGLEGKKAMIVETDQLFPVVQIVEQFFDRFFFVNFLMFFPEGICAEWRHAGFPGVGKQRSRQFFMFGGQMLPTALKLVSAITFFQFSPGTQSFNHLSEKNLVQ